MKKASHNEKTALKFLENILIFQAKAKHKWQHIYYIEPNFSMVLKEESVDYFLFKLLIEVDYTNDM